MFKVVLEFEVGEVWNVLLWFRWEVEIWFRKFVIEYGFKDWYFKSVGQVFWILLECEYILVNVVE